MQYILHRDYEGKTISGNLVKFAKGQEFNCVDGLIYNNNSPVCFNTSQVAYEYFADNDDGNGELRGKWVYLIAFKRFGEGYRFNDEQQRIICDYYPKYIRHDCDTIIFNDKFYHLPIETYEMIGQDLGMKLEDMA